MNPRPLAALAAFFIVSPAAHADPNEALAYAIGSCASSADDKARLSCYDQIATQLKGGAAVPVAAAPPAGAQPAVPPEATATAAPAAVPPPPVEAQAPAQPALADNAAPAGPPPPPRNKHWYNPSGWFESDSRNQQQTPAQFGNENLPPAPGQQPAPVVAQAPAPPPAKEEKAWYDPSGWFEDDSRYRQQAPAPSATVGEYVPPPPITAPGQYTPQPIVPQPQYTPEPSAPTQQYVPPEQYAPQTAVPPAQYAAQPAAPPVQAAPQDTTTQFGSEALPPQQPAPVAAAPGDTLTAMVADYAFNARGLFTLFLDNGQVWQQVDGDAPVRFSKQKKQRQVTISRNPSGGYELVIDNWRQIHKVKRVK